MAKESGTNVLLQVSTGSPTSFVTVAGQQSTQWNGETETDDVTDKANNGWGSTLTTLIRGTVNVSGKCNWPDTNGMEILFAGWRDRANVECKLILDSAGKHYRGLMAVTAANVDGPHNGASSYSFTLQSAEQMTYAAS
jgi:predicted secreted protein